MHNLVMEAKNQITAILTDALAAAMNDGTLPQGESAAFVVEVPADKKNGDFASNCAMVNARTFRKAPRQIAEAIAAHANLEGTYCDRIEIAGPGFINFFLKPEWFGDTVLAVLTDKDNYGKTNMGQGKKAMVEFVSANPTGPMHLGNARGGSLGDGLAEVLSWAGYDVTREFYINDAGNQIDKFGKSLSGRYLQHFKGEENVPFAEDLYQGGDIKELAEQYIAENGDSLLEAEAADREAALVAFALPKNIAKLESDLGKYRIKYDVWFKESVLH
ncbi:MAG: arginine--tRNA ligase, partial [Oscillospiraceae bacterium]|nr:arginine--tRNA ligase [Oscillospiraceae bacterium]